MANYTPFTLSNFEQRPYGPVAGVDAAFQDARTAQAQRLDLQSMLTANQQAQANLERYQGETPNQLAISDLKGATARQTDPRIMAQGQHGEALKSKAEGDKLTQMLESDVAAGKAKNAFEAAAARYKQGTAELSMVHQAMGLLDQAGPPGSPQSQGIWQQILTKVPPQLQQQLPRAYSPQVRQMIEKILQQTPEHLQKLAEIAATGRENQYNTELHNEGTLAVARTAAGASRYATDAQLASQNENKRKTALFQTIAKGAEKPGELEEATRYLAKDIGESTEVKEASRMLMLDLIEKQGANAGRITEGTRAMKENMWNQQAPGRLKDMNPFRKPKPSTDPKAPKLPKGVVPLPNG